MRHLRAIGRGSIKAEIPKHALLQSRVWTISRIRARWEAFSGYQAHKERPGPSHGHPKCAPRFCPITHLCYLSLSYYPSLPYLWAVPVLWGYAAKSEMWGGLYLPCHCVLLPQWANVSESEEFYSRPAISPPP